jgi:hypothetical protein
MEEMKMTIRFKALLTTAITVASLAVLSPAIARDNAPMGTITKESLKGQGYTCEYVATGFWECTKPGGTTYWCDAGSCQPKPLVGPAVNKFPRPKLNTLMLSR